MLRSEILVAEFRDFAERFFGLGKKWREELRVAFAFEDPKRSFVAVKSSLDAIAWISDRFAGRPAPGDCEKP